MTKRNALFSGALATALVFGAAALAQKPAQNIDPHAHGNLAEAQQHIVQAYEKIDAAQQVNKEDLGGHAEKAKQFLNEADQELKQAAEYADHKHK